MTLNEDIFYNIYKCVFNKILHFHKCKLYAKVSINTLVFYIIHQVNASIENNRSKKSYRIVKRLNLVSDESLF